MKLAGLDEAVHVFKAFLESVLHERGVDLSVLHAEVLRVGVGVGERVQQEVHDLLIVGGGGAEQADFIVHAVAVGVLRNEGFQHGAEILGGLGHIQSERVQPFLINPRVIPRAAPHGILIGGQAVVVAVGHAHDLQERFLRFRVHAAVQILRHGRVGQIRVQREQQAAHGVVVFGHIVQLKVDDVRNVGLGGHDDGQLGLRVGGGVFEELQLYAELLFNGLRGFVGFEILNQRVGLAGDGERDDFLFRGREGKRGGQQAQSHKNGQQTGMLHVNSSNAVFPAQDGVIIADAREKW